MAIFGASGAQKARKQAREWVSLAHKIDHFRRDVMPSADLDELRRERAALDVQIRDKEATSSTLESAVKSLEKVLKRVGGSFYPRSFWVENIEMILVAAILAIGIRTYFLQPFKIPTNSMYPTYNGLTVHPYYGDEAPGAVGKVWNLATLGATNRSLEGAPGDELVLPLVDGNVLRARRIAQPRGRFDHGGAIGRSALFLDQQVIPGRQWFVFPALQMQYRFQVGENSVAIKTPMDFPMDDLLQAIVREQGGVRDVRQTGPGEYAVYTGLSATEAGKLLSFDVRTGDMLFVDRFTYHFRKPAVGDPFVFLTDDIVQMDRAERGKYYIKRIAGGPGDTLEIRPPVLWRNGEPATDHPAFARNAEQEGEYGGYVQIAPGWPFSGETPVTIPDREYAALGDNSRNSADSRYWGFVPEPSIVGKAIFIYYPFSHRWGLAE